MLILTLYLVLKFKNTHQEIKKCNMLSFKYYFNSTFKI
jgi:hypothetical protein